MPWLPGFRQFQMFLQDALALRYNDIAPLENHHASASVMLSKTPSCSFQEVSHPEHLDPVCCPLSAGNALLIILAFHKQICATLLLSWAPVTVAGLELVC